MQGRIEFSAEDAQNNITFIESYLGLNVANQHSFYSENNSRTRVGILPSMGYSYIMHDRASIEEQEFLELLVAPKLQLVVNARPRFDHYDQIILFVTDYKNEAIGTLEASSSIPYTEENLKMVQGLVQQVYQHELADLI